MNSLTNLKIETAQIVKRRIIGVNLIKYRSNKHCLKVIKLTNVRIVITNCVVKWHVFCLECSCLQYFPVFSSWFSVFFATHAHFMWAGVWHLPLLIWSKRKSNLNKFYSKTKKCVVFQILSENPEEESKFPPSNGIPVTLCFTSVQWDVKILNPSNEFLWKVRMDWKAEFIHDKCLNLMINVFKVFSIRVCAEFIPLNKTRKNVMQHLFINLSGAIFDWWFKLLNILWIIQIN